MNTDALVLRVFEGKVLRKIFGPVRVGNDFRIRSNDKLYELLYVVQRINIHWLGHVVRMNDDALARWIVDAGICGSRGKGLRCLRWKDQDEELYHRLICATGIGAQEVEAPE